MAEMATTQQHRASFFNQASDCSTKSYYRGPSKSYTTNNNPSRKQLLRQVHSTDELMQPYHLLTIAIDSRHSCPDLCTFVHPLLPSWVRYRQLHFNSEVDLAEILKDDHGHVIVVARTNIVNIANWAVARRTNHTNTTSSDGVPTTGLFHNADERFHKGEIVDVYDKFDYVLRQYYQRDEDGKFHGYTLHALGNYTCGTKQQSLPLSETESGPRWGIHYVPLNAHTVDVQLLHHATSNYPTSLRPTNCSFIGRADVKRSKHERENMKIAVEEHGAELNCTVTYTGAFATGNSKFEYFNYDISQAKIGLSPRGSAIETHRLTELLRMGSVPAIVAEDYLFATFKSVPGIIAEDWPGVVQSMKKYLAEEREVLAANQIGAGTNMSKLEMLSREGTKFYRDLEACMMADMDFILKGAFGLLSG
eukprot:CAMPEP_0172309242 /NCGR_PEP_ID=MMETSP1058-20130122/9595_1 /TAXON_ID=83371 /ORGANISM="Detonula confervacea, Strain CCMP 353" /LENGTH=419 /DNA_ID=CAMNT_0013021835 /DNA_START=87 /DNA_END=1346 /DNA_ORIENTATION=+